MTQPTSLIHDFAAPLTPASGSEFKLAEWIAQVHGAALPQLHRFAMAWNSTVPPSTPA